MAEGEGECQPSRRIMSISEGMKNKIAFQEAYTKKIEELKDDIGSDTPFCLMNPGNFFPMLPSMDEDHLCKKLLSYWTYNFANVRNETRIINFLCSPREKDVRAFLSAQNEPHRCDTVFLHLATGRKFYAHSIYLNESERVKQEILFNEVRDGEQDARTRLIEINVPEDDCLDPRALVLVLFWLYTETIYDTTYLTLEQLLEYKRYQYTVINFDLGEVYKIANYLVLPKLQAMLIEKMVEGSAPQKKREGMISLLGLVSRGPELGTDEIVNAVLENARVMWGSLDFSVYPFFMDEDLAQRILLFNLRNTLTLGYNMCVIQMTYNYSTKQMNELFGCIAKGWKELNQGFINPGGPMSLHRVLDSNHIVHYYPHVKANTGMFPLVLPDCKKVLPTFDILGIHRHTYVRACYLSFLSGASNEGHAKFVPDWYYPFACKVVEDLNFDTYSSRQENTINFFHQQTVLDNKHPAFIYLHHEMTDLGYSLPKHYLHILDCMCRSIRFAQTLKRKHMEIRPVKRARTEPSLVLQST